MKMSSISVPTSTKNVLSDNHQAAMFSLPCASSCPRLGVSGGTPRPRKSRLVNARMAPLMRNGRKVITGVRLFGNRCLSMMSMLLRPMARAART